MSLRRVGPEQLRQLLFHASVVTKTQLTAFHFPGHSILPEQLESENAARDGRPCQGGRIVTWSPMEIGQFPEAIR